MNSAASLAPAARSSSSVGPRMMVARRVSASSQSSKRKWQRSISSPADGLVRMRDRKKTSRAWLRVSCCHLSSPASCTKASQPPMLIALPPYTSLAGQVGPGLVGPGLVGPGLVRPGLVGPGLAGPGLVGPGLVRPGLVGPGLVAPTEY